MKERMLLKKQQNKDKNSKTTQIFVPSKTNTTNPTPVQPPIQTQVNAPSQNPNQMQGQMGSGMNMYQNQMAYMDVKQLHIMFETKKININMYTQCFQHTLLNQINIEKNKQMRMMMGSFNPMEFGIWEKQIIYTETKHYWNNYFLYFATQMMIDKKALAKCLNFLDFKQIDRIIQTFKKYSTDFIEQKIQDEEVRITKLREMEDFIEDINNFLNDHLDMIEQYQNTDYDQDYNDYNDYDDYSPYGNDKNKKGKNKKPKKKQPQAPKKVKVREKKKKVFTKREEQIDIETLLKEQEKKVQEKGERAKLSLFNRQKEPLNIIFIGHVDCGKSTICGNILVKSGKVNDLEIKKFQQEAQDKDRESWFLAYIMDLNEEERSKGKTVEVGRATFETKNKRFTILDCPGHEKYLINMLSGAAQADVASLVISAKPGEFESGFEKNGQTKQHAMLAKALGVQRLVIVVNKMDLVDWSKDRFDYIQQNLGEFLKYNCGYEDNEIFWTVISGLHGTNLAERMDNNVAPWFYGQSLFETLDSLPKIKKAAKPFLRIPLLDKYRDQGNNMVFGKIESGIIKSNMKCVIMPTQKEIEVVKIFDNDDNAMLFGEAGENVKLQIKGCDLEEIKRGYVICGQQFWCNVSQEFIAEIKILELNNNQIFNEGFTLIMHLHTVLQEVTVKKIKKRIDDEGVEDKEFKKKKIKRLESQEKGEIILKTNTPICLEKFEEFSELGRFTLRKDNNTIAIGQITKFKPFDRDLLEYTNFFMYEKNNMDL